MSGGWKVESLTRQHDRQSFDCGIEELNEFVKKHARQNADKDVSRTYAAVAPSSSRVLGYYTICAGSVDKSAQEKGLGASLA